MKLKDFIVNLEEKSEKDLYYFGEFWVNSRDINNKYLYETKYKTNLLDTVLHFNFHEASMNGQGYDMRKIFDNTIVQEHPILAVTFVDNHDSQPGQSLESFVEPWFKKIAYGLILLRKDGYPCIFYGDYFGIEHDGIEGQQGMIDNLLWIRNNYAYGNQVDYFVEPQLIGWVRTGDEEHPGSLAVVISTGDMKTLQMNVGADQAGKHYVDLTGGNKNEVIIDEEGNGNFEVGSGTLSAWAEAPNTL